MKNHKYKTSVTLRLDEDVIREIDILADASKNCRSSYIEHVLRTHIIAKLFESDAPEGGLADAGK